VTAAALAKSHGRVTDPYASGGPPERTVRGPGDGGRLVSGRGRKARSGRQQPALYGGPRTAHWESLEPLHKYGMLGVHM